VESIQADISRSSKRSWIMKQYSKKLFSLAVLCGTAAGMLHADNDHNGNRVVPFLQWRSQGRDQARKLYGTTSYAVYQDYEDYEPSNGDRCGWGWFGFGTFNVTVQYDQSFRGKEITQALFGPAIIEDFRATGTTITTTTGNCNRSCDDSCGNDSIVISGMNAATIGTATTNRGPRELMAENFLLPRDFRSVITFAPKVQDVVVDFNLFVGLDRWVHGLYFRLYGPVVWNRATLKPCETIIAEGTEAAGAYSRGYFDPLAAVPTDSLFASALSYFGGCPFPGDYDGESVTVQPLRFAKFSNCNLPITTTTVNNCDRSCDNECDSFRRHKTGFAELRGELGYNYMCEKYRFLINLQAAAPTGSKVKAQYLLPAQVGNGHHWELGVGIGGAWKMWCDEEMERSFNFIVEADITHLFSAKQQRTFDLKCKPLSRYMLAQRLVDNTDLDADSILVAPSNAGVQFPVLDPDEGVTVGGEYAPVANFSTRNVKVSIGVQGDLVAMFNYTCRGFSWDLGYNFWAMSSSKISLKCDDNCPDACGILPFPVDTWALKGDASIAGYSLGTSIDPLDPDFTVGLAATEGGTATIFGATAFAGTNGAPVTALSLTNPNIDNPELAFFNPTGTAVTALNAFGTVNPIFTSVDPVFISIDDLDIAGAEQRGLSHKVFTHLSYTWRDCSDRWMPYVGAGVSAEFGSHSGSDCSDEAPTLANCDTCPSALSFALSKWAVEIKGGVSFH
jgi:hypothetical protein